MKLESLGSLAGWGRVLFSTDARRFAAKYSGKMALVEHLRVYTDFDFENFDKVAHRGFSEFAMSSTGRYIVTPHNAPGGVSGWRIAAKISDIETGRTASFRSELTGASGLWGTKLVAISPDERLIAACADGIEQKVHVVDVESCLKSPFDFDTTYDKRATTFAFHDAFQMNGTHDVIALIWTPDGKTILQISMAGASANFAFWTLTKKAGGVERIGLSGKLALDEVVGRHAPSPSVVSAFSPDSTLLAVAGNVNNPLRLIDVASHTLAASLSHESKSMKALAFSPKGSLLVSGDSEGELRIWQVSGKGAKATLDSHDSERLAGPVLGLAFAPDGKSVVVATEKDKKNIELFRVAISDS